MGLKWILPLFSFLLILWYVHAAKSFHSRLQPFSGFQQDRLRKRLSVQEYLLRFRNHTRVHSKIQVSEYTQAEVMLFVVNYHYRKYAASLFFERDFFPRFSRHYKYDFDVLYVGPSTEDQFRIYNNHLPEKGYYSYHSLSIAYHYLCQEHHICYSGYFLMNDDSCLDPIQLNSYNHHQSMSEERKRWSPTHPWKWNTEFNEDGKLFADTIQQAVQHLKQLSHRVSKCPFVRDEIFYGWADFFFVYAGDMSLFLRLEQEMYDQRVFLELAIPTILSCFHSTTIADCNHGQNNSNASCVHSHPHKYYSQHAQTSCLSMVDFSAVLYPLSF